MVGDAAKDSCDHVFGQKREQAVRDEDGRAVGRDGVRPALVGQRHRHGVRALARRKHPVAQRGDAWQIDAVPVDRGRRRDAVEPAVEARAEVDDDSIRMFGHERAHTVVEHLGAQRRLTYHTGLQTQPGEVVVDLADDVVRQPVAQDRPRPLAVQRTCVFGEKCRLFERSQVGGGDAHDREGTPFFRLNGQPKTFTALAITSANVVNETIACRVIIAFAQRVIGIVSVGENATTLVMLT